ncbi:MAG TPA: hypothetical protein ENG09_05375 [Candidatus Syntrophoarchaeum butanivorans]|uniref:Uncharacterized protein n=1 Tax=Candidatus Syntropharchaeum butanivorans TaxID=1839936 RepID=A0A7C1B2Q2_9EURY|nr:hypothetical protein [Candidatus Syntrophoarchaeum butanivorans]
MRKDKSFITLDRIVSRKHRGLSIGPLVSILFFLAYTISTALVIIYISTLLGLAFMFLSPLIILAIAPERMVEFLSFELCSPMDGAVSICNLHLLLTVWTVFFAIVTYTEFLIWYTRHLEED